MTLYLIGLGLGDVKDITIRGLEIVQNCHEIYLENYTSLLQSSIRELENLYKKKIFLADRNLVENKFSEIIQRAKDLDIALLIIGDVFSATTHIAILQEARLNKIPYRIINNASVLTAVGITGLEIYKFGRTASIPFNNKDIKTPITILKENQKSNLHTLFLLDLDNINKKYLTIKDAVNYLEKNKIKSSTLAVACARLGSDNVIKSGALKELKNKDYGKPPYCLIIPAKKLHFMEEDMLKEWK